MTQPYLSGHISQRINVTLLQRYLYTHVYHGTSHNNQIKKPAYSPNNRYKKKKYIYTMKYYSAIKKTGIISFWEIDGTGDHPVK
jgi:hypothetical protein